MIRLATQSDIEAVTAIYNRIHKMEGDGLMRMGCLPSTLSGQRLKTIARKIYLSLGYHEVGIVPCSFNGIPDIEVVLFEESKRMHG